MRCRHCYQHRFDESRELDAEALCRIADEIDAEVPPTTFSVNLTGGEPLLFPPLLPLLRHLRRLPSCQGIDIITNGTISDHELLSKIGTCEKLRSIKVSLESPHRGRNDEIRGRGSFDAVCRFVPQATSQLQIPVFLMMTVARYNFADILSMTTLAQDIGAAGIIFERFIPLGRGARQSDQMLDAAEWAQLSLTVADIAGMQLSLKDLRSYRAFWLRFSSHATDELSGAPCNLGKSMALMPDGTVYPCRRLPLKLGNILDDGFPAIRERLREYDISCMRSRIHGSPCQSCPEPDCAGCRAAAHARSDDRWGPDPQCCG